MRFAGAARRVATTMGSRHKQSSNAFARSAVALPERSSPSTLHVFDLDQTLVNTPGPEEGRVQWHRATGRPWGWTGWWGRPESLDARLDSTPGPALHAYTRAVQDSSAVVVVLTGRRAHLLSAVLVHASRHGCDAAHHFLMNDTPLETLPFKTQTLKRLVAQYSSVRSVHIYEDRQPHAEAFSALGASSPEFAHLASWDVHLVVQPSAEATSVTPTSQAAVPGEASRWPRPRVSSPLSPGLDVEALRMEDGDDTGVFHTMDTPDAETKRRASSALQRPLPHFELLHYLRLNVALPEEMAAAVPPQWRAAKVTRDGEWPPAHVTIATSAELKQLGMNNTASRARLWALVRQARTGPVTIVGLGCAVDPQGSGAACTFAVVDCPPCRWLRRQLGLPPNDAHITLGFDGNDVHDGVRKGRNALLQPPANQTSWGTGPSAIDAMAAALQRRVNKLRSRASKAKADAEASAQTHQQAHG